MKRKLLLIGSGGHCASVLDSLLMSGDFDEVSAVSNTEPEVQLACEIVGTDDDLARLKASGYPFAFIAVGSIGDTSIRKRLYEKLKSLGFVLPNIIDPSAVVAQDVKLGEGIYVGKKAVVGARSRIGNCAIINTAAVVEHDCEIGEFVHLSPSSTLCGSVTIGASTHIGASSVVRESLRIGENVIIGIGSVVVKKIDSNVTAFGNPCKER